MEEIKAILSAIYKKLTAIDDKLQNMYSNDIEITMGMSIIQKDISNIQYDVSNLAEKGGFIGGGYLCFARGALNISTSLFDNIRLTAISYQTFNLGCFWWRQ